MPATSSKATQSQFVVSQAIIPSKRIEANVLMIMEGLRNYKLAYIHWY